MNKIKEFQKSLEDNVKLLSKLEILVKEFLETNKDKFEFVVLGHRSALDYSDDGRYSGLSTDNQMFCHYYVDEKHQKEWPDYWNDNEEDLEKIQEIANGKYSKSFQLYIEFGKQVKEQAYDEAFFTHIFGNYVDVIFEQDGSIEVEEYPDYSVC